MKRFAQPVICSALLLLAGHSFAQDGATAGRVTPKELTIPASAIFDLMGATPSQINRTADIKDFKVDWSLKYGINPNLAIQSQPIWEIFYNRRDLSKYQNTSAFMRRLASLDISLGTIQDDNDYRRIGAAVKMNLIRQKDPLMAKDLYEDISAKYKNEKVELEQLLKETKYRLDTTTNILNKPALRLEIRSIEDQLNTQNSRRMAEINGRAKIFVDENWNASSLDMAVGKTYTFKSDSTGLFGMRRDNRSSGLGVWLNGNLGLGKKILMTCLVRSFWYDEEVNFMIKDLTTGDEAAQKTSAKNTVYSMGLNFRYGGSVYTFFFEMLYEYKKIKTPVDALNSAYKLPGNVQVIGSSINWEDIHPTTLAIGGDWRISRSVIINYGMRCVFDSQWKFKAFVPVATISCMMR